MAVVNLKSTNITNRDATPRILSNARVAGSAVQHARGTVSGGVADTTASTYRFCTIPSNAVPISVRLTTTGTGTVGAMDIGIYKNVAEGGAAVSAALFTSAKLLTTALEKFEGLYESTTITKANAEKALWELLGLSVDPNLIYDVVGTLSATVDAAHDMVLEVDYTK